MTDLGTPCIRTSSPATEYETYNRMFWAGRPLSVTTREHIICIVWERDSLLLKRCAVCFTPGDDGNATILRRRFTCYTLVKELYGATKRSRFTAICNSVQQQMQFNNIRSHYLSAQLFPADTPGLHFSETVPSDCTVLVRKLCCTNR
jgi:hypothetical protein